MTVWIVGYTNAGKSTLLNALTNKWVLAEDKLFATLWTSVWKMWIAPPLNSPPKGEMKLQKLSPTGGKMSEGQIGGDEIEYKYIPGKEVLLSDTIWFIRELPPELVDAFASTLEDSIESDILFHVVDASDPKIGEKIQVVDDILDTIGAIQPRIYVFNKTDNIDGHTLVELKKRYFKLKPLYISTKHKQGFDALIETMLHYS